MHEAQVRPPTGRTWMARSLRNNGIMPVLVRVLAVLILAVSATAQGRRGSSKSVGSGPVGRTSSTSARSVSQAPRTAAPRVATAAPVARTPVRAARRTVSRTLISTDRIRESGRTPSSGAPAQLTPLRAVRGVNSPAADTMAGAYAVGHRTEPSAVERRTIGMARLRTLPSGNLPRMYDAPRTNRTSVLGVQGARSRAGAARGSAISIQPSGTAKWRSQFSDMEDWKGWMKETRAVLGSATQKAGEAFLGGFTWGVPWTNHPWGGLWNGGWSWWWGWQWNSVWYPHLYHWGWHHHHSHLWHYPHGHHHDCSQVIQITQPVEMVVQAAEPQSVVIDPAAGMADTSASASGSGFAIDPGAAEAWIRLGDRHFRAGSYARAADAYMRARDLAPGEPAIELVLADALFALGDYHYAAHAIRSAVAKDGTLLDGQVDKRGFYEDVRAFDAQMEVLEDFLLDHPGDADAWTVLAVNRLFSGNAGGAVRAAANGLAITPREPALTLIQDKEVTR